MKRRLVSFDWALKRLLRSKANFEILEGFLSELLKEEIVILEVLEGESNQEHHRQKFNRVDLKVTNQRGEIVIIEVQYDREFDYLQRIFFATCRAATEYLQAGDSYRHLAKVISVNILYFDLGQGQDYIYHGKTHFTGIHRHDELKLSERQKELFGKESPAEIYPEYYLLKINQFDDIARDRIDQWIYFLKHEEVPDGFDAKGLRKAKEVLNILHLSAEERVAYESYAEDLHYQASMFESSYGDGLRVGINAGIQEGKSIGIQEGEHAKAIAIAGNLLSVLDDATIAHTTGLSQEEVTALRSEHEKQNYS